MAFLTPKTNWGASDVPAPADFNRIEGNVLNLASLRSVPKAGGTGTAITVNTVHFELVDGRSFSFIATASNGGAATTINADSTGVKNLYKPGTTSAPSIAAGKCYTVWYDSASNCFFVKASAEGTALAGDVLAGTTFSNNDDTGIVGTLALTGTAGAGDVLSGKTFYNTNAKTKVTGTIASKGAQTYTPSTVNQTIASGQFLSGVQTILGDPDLAAANIKAGINIFGVTGASIEGKRFATGTAHRSSASMSGRTRLDGGIINVYNTSVTGLAFAPSIVILYGNVGLSGTSYKGFITVATKNYELYNPYFTDAKIILGRGLNSTGAGASPSLVTLKLESPAEMGASNFNLPVGYVDYFIFWIAIE